MLALVLAVAAAIAPPPVNARFDYQIGEPYTPPRGVRVVSRDWFDAKPPRRGYAICGGASASTSRSPRSAGATASATPTGASTATT